VPELVLPEPSKGQQSACAIHGLALRATQSSIRPVLFFFDGLRLPAASDSVFVLATHHCKTGALPGEISMPTPTSSKHPGLAEPNNPLHIQRMA
jgi:hypothetical protein